jgi:hypothetical protein
MPRGCLLVAACLGLIVLVLPLSLDGIAQRSTLDVDLLEFAGAHFLLKENLTNYPAGLSAGQDTFVASHVVDGVVDDTVTVAILFT